MFLWYWSLMIAVSEPNVIVVLEPNVIAVSEPNVIVVLEPIGGGGGA